MLPEPDHDGMNASLSVNNKSVFLVSAIQDAFQLGNVLEIDTQNRHWFTQVFEATFQLVRIATPIWFASFCQFRSYNIQKTTLYLLKLPQKR